jgi:uncharacterized ubiquitin-like protein YukD
VFLPIGICICYLADQKKVVQMKQEEVTERIIRIMLDQRLINEEDVDIVASFLLQAYAAGYDLGLKRQQKGKAVVQLTLEGKKIHIYNSTLQAADAVGAHYDNIRQAARGVQQTAKGYKWKYLSEFKS